MKKVNISLFLLLISSFVYFNTQSFNFKGLDELSLEIIAKEISRKLIDEAPGTSLLKSVKAQLPPELINFINAALIKKFNKNNIPHKTLFMGIYGIGLASIEFSPDSKYAATLSQDKTLRLWNLTELPIRLAYEIDDAISVKFSSDSKYALTISKIGTVELLDLTKLPIIPQQLETAGSFVNAIFSSNSKYALTSSSHSTLFFKTNALLWDLTNSPATSQQISGSESVLQELIHGYKIFHPEFSPNSKFVLTQHQNGSLWLQDLTKAPIAAQPLLGKLIENGPYFSPDSKYAVTKSVNGLIFSDLTKPHIARQHLADFAESLKFSPDSKYALTQSIGIGSLWDLTQQPITSADIKGNIGDITSFTFSPNSQYLLTKPKNGAPKLWNFMKSPITSHRLGDDTGEIFSVGFSPDSNYALTKSNNTIYFWDLTKSPITSQSVTVDAEIFQIKFSPNSKNLLLRGRLLLAELIIGTSVLFDLTGLKITKQIFPDNNVIAMEFSPDGQYILTESADGSINLWDLNILNKLSTTELALVNKYEKLKKEYLPLGDLLNSTEYKEIIANSPYKQELETFFFN